MRMSKEEFRAKILRDQAIRKVFKKFYAVRKKPEKEMQSAYFSKSLLGDSCELNKLERRAKQLEDDEFLSY